ncbi:MAG: hypothetical protein BWZ10_02777 [candidate division BRC1 bacterium ADurb.BinA364]|nr:MAG: hypothetical protein BWZ10_02777 [candidate division BRC1 bacterium ADurb.BinA364]
MTVAQSQIDGAAREYIIQAGSGRHADHGRIDQQRPFGIEAEAAQIMLGHIVMKAVMLRRFDRIKLVDLNKSQTGHPGARPAAQAGLFQMAPRLRLVPGIQKAHRPLDEIFGRFAGRQTDGAFRILAGPFQKAQRRQAAQRGIIRRFDHADLLGGLEAQRPAGQFEKAAFDLAVRPRVRSLGCLAWTLARLIGHGDGLPAAARGAFGNKMAARNAVALVARNAVALVARISQRRVARRSHLRRITRMAAIASVSRRARF